MPQREADICRLRAPTTARDAAGELVVSEITGEAVSLLKPLSRRELVQLAVDALKLAQEYDSHHD